MYLGTHHVKLPTSSERFELTTWQPQPQHPMQVFTLSQDRQWEGSTLYISHVGVNSEDNHFQQTLRSNVHHVFWITRHRFITSSTYFEECDTRFQRVPIVYGNLGQLEG